MASGRQRREIEAAATIIARREILAIPEPSGFAPLAHTHSASAIASGTLSAARLPTLDTVPAPVAAVNFNGQQATSFRVENRTSDPVSPTTGQVWLRTDL
jgi:hypothetical protein